MSQSRPEISVVIPVYNREKIVVRTLDSVKAQTHRPLVVILVDNNSSDNSMSVLWQWAEANQEPDFCVTVTSETARGAAAARNRGLALVETPYILFFDSDDTMRPELVAQYVGHIHRHPDADIVYTASNYHSLDGGERKLKICRRRLLRNHIYHTLLNTQGYIVRTDLLRAVGAWNPAMLGWNDWELGLRLLLNTSKVVYMPGVFVDVYAQRDSITGVDFASRPSVWERALDQAERVIGVSGRRDRGSLRRLIDYRRVLLAARYAREGADDEARRLYDYTMKDKKQGLRMKLLMPLVYSYAKRGGRGSAAIVDWLI